MSNVADFSQTILKDLLADFPSRHLSATDLRDGYVGLDIAALKTRYCSEISASPVDFDLALKELEEGGLADTGPLAPYDNPPNSELVFLAMFSKREYVYLTEKGYKAAQKATAKRIPKATAPQVNISGGHFHQSPIGIGSYVSQSLTGTFGDAPIFTSLRKAIDESNLVDDEREKLLVRITAMQKAPDTPSFLARYTDFIAVAADHMTIIAPFLPALAALFTGQHN